MKAKYIQPETSILSVCGKEYIMDVDVINGSKATNASSGNGGWDDEEIKLRGDFDKEITYGNIW